MPIYIGHNSVVKKGSKIFMGINGTYKSVSRVDLGRAGSIRNVFPGASLETLSGFVYVLSNFIDGGYYNSSDDYQMSSNYISDYSQRTTGSAQIGAIPSESSLASGVGNSHIVEVIGSFGWSGTCGMVFNIPDMADINTSGLYLMPMKTFLTTFDSEIDSFQYTEYCSVGSSSSSAWSARTSYPYGAIDHYSYDSFANGSYCTMTKESNSEHANSSTRFFGNNVGRSSSWTGYVACSMNVNGGYFTLNGKKYPTVVAVSDSLVETKTNSDGTTTTEKFNSRFTTT